jgi:hypothetical protein
MSKDEIDAMIEERFNATISSERRRLAELESTALEQINEDQLDLLARA